MRDEKYHLAVLEDKLLETVKKQVAQVPRPFGILLSGGFDSGLLAALTKPDFVFTLRFPFGTYYDESHYADAIISHLGLEKKTTIIEFTENSFKESVDDAIKTMGEPVSHFSLVPLYAAMGVMAGHKVYNVLSGEGPDEYLGGYARQIIFDHLKKLYSIPELRRYHGMVDKMVGNKLSVKSYGEFVGYNPYDVETWMYKNEEFMDLARERGDIHGVIGKMDMDLGVIEKMEQKLASHFGLTLHYPYINDDFADYCYNLPDDLKIRNGVTKWGFRQICKKYLPEIMMDRDKMGGPVYPVNKIMGWGDGKSFDKTRWMQYQEGILHGK